MLKFVESGGKSYSWSPIKYFIWSEQFDQQVGYLEKYKDLPCVLFCQHDDVGFDTDDLLHIVAKMEELEKERA